MSSWGHSAPDHPGKFPPETCSRSRCAPLTVPSPCPWSALDAGTARPGATSLSHQSFPHDSSPRARQRRAPRRRGRLASGPQRPRRLPNRAAGQSGPPVANRVKRPCLDCGTPTRGSRCDTCRTTHDRTARAHYRDDYEERAGQLRVAYPHGPCYLCGKPITQPKDWSAHHVDPGNPDSPLRPTHLRCNQSFGQGGRG